MNNKHQELSNNLYLQIEKYYQGKLKDAKE
jgi:hypothetical protein